MQLETCGAKRRGHVGRRLSTPCQPGLHGALTLKWSGRGSQIRTLGEVRQPDNRNQRLFPRETRIDPPAKARPSSPTSSRWTESPATWMPLPSARAGKPSRRQLAALSQPKPAAKVSKPPEKPRSASPPKLQKNGFGGAPHALSGREGARDMNATAAGFGRSSGVGVRSYSPSPTSDASRRRSNARLWASRCSLMIRFKNLAFPAKGGLEPKLFTKPFARCTTFFAASALLLDRGFCICVTSLRRGLGFPPQDAQKTDPVRSRG